MQAPRRLAIAAVAGTCALAGAAAGISQSAASSSAGKSNANAKKASNPGPPGGGHPGHGGPGEVHAVEVVLNKAGTAYINETDDNGTITAVDSGTITLKEGTSSLTYATPTITIPSGTSVMLDGETSSLDKLKVGDHVSISSSSDGTNVFAIDSSFKPGEGHGPMGGPPPGSQPPSQG